MKRRRKVMEKSIHGFRECDLVRLLCNRMSIELEVDIEDGLLTIEANLSYGDDHIDSSYASIPLPRV